MVRSANRGDLPNPARCRESNPDVGGFRQHFENDKQWSARRAFILKHIEEYRGNAIDKLLALSMVWVNHVFLGSRYGPELMLKVLDMADGIDLGPMPSYELVPNDETRKRPCSSDDASKEAKKTKISKFGFRPRFEPVQFVSGNEDKNQDDDEYEMKQAGETSNVRQKEPEHQTYNSSYNNPHCSTQSYTRNVASSEASGMDCGVQRPSTNFLSRVQQEYTTKYEAQMSRQPPLNTQVDRSGAAGRARPWDSGRSGMGFRQDDQSAFPKTHNRAYEDPNSNGLSSTVPTAPSFTTTTLREKQILINNLSSAVAVNLKDPSFNGPLGLHYNFILSRSVQSCKTNPEYIYVNFKNIPPAELPKSVEANSVGYACEVRCQGVYLATGYASSKHGARVLASKQAVKLFMQPAEVRVVERLYKRQTVRDMVVCTANSPNPTLPPPLRNPEDKISPNLVGQYEPDQRKKWTEFVVRENSNDAICILNNSAAFNRMKVEYTFEPSPQKGLWLCSVYLQSQLVAQASGTKKSSKHAAAEEAVRKLRTNQATREQQQQEEERYSAESYSSYPPSHHVDMCGDGKFGKLVIFENNDVPICILNDTAQFNKVAADYKFTVLPDNQWRCEVFIDGKFVASATGSKSSVKRIAAVEALAILRQTQPVVKSTLKKDISVGTISRNSIMARSSKEFSQQEIKEDNIGNQLLRKMGWKGGGLGKEGVGIAEPIKVKEQFRREGLGLEADKCGNRLTKHDIVGLIRNYVSSDSQDDLRFSDDLNKEERKMLHLMSTRYGLRSKSYGHGKKRFLVISRKFYKKQLIDQLLEEGQVGRYELVKPQASQ